MSSCPICQRERHVAFREKLLGKYEVAYLVCPGCALVQAEEPYWLEEAYDHAISPSDTGIVQRNLWLAQRSTLILSRLFGKADVRFLDLGGGTGLFVRLMRDRGFEFYWTDPYATNVLAQGFADTGGRPYSALTAFDVMEHVPDPLAFVRESFDQHSARTVLFTQELYGNNVPEQDWWYWGFEHGQHISFYNNQTLHVLASQLGVRTYSSGTLHLLTDRTVNQRWLDLAASRLGTLLDFTKYGRRPSLVAPDHSRAIARE